MLDNHHSKAYQKINKNNPPRNLATRLSNYLSKGMSILDIGCGAGTDSIYFLQQDCRVTAIDIETTMIEKKKFELEEDLRDKLTIINADFTNTTLPYCDAIYASFSLPFCEPNKFMKLYSKLDGALGYGGIFAAIFFGTKDDWYRTVSNITFHRQEEIKEMFKEYVIKEFEEKEYEGTYVDSQGNIVNKHWHIYEVIAVKDRC